MRALLEASYPDELALARDNGTQNQLESTLSKRGLKAATTQKKAAAFFLQAIEYAEIPASGYFTKSRPSTGSGGNRRNGATKKAAKKSTVTAAKPESDSPPPPSTAGLNLDEKRSAYIDLLLKLAEKEKGSEKVLERLDKLLGWSGPPQQAGAESQEGRR